MSILYSCVCEIVCCEYFFIHAFVKLFENGKQVKSGNSGRREMGMKLAALLLRCQTYTVSIKPLCFSIFISFD